MRFGLFSVFIVVLGVLLFVFFSSASQTEVLVMNNGAADTVPADWETHEEMGLAFSYPPQATVGIENERLKVTYVGQDSQMSEITDGFTFFLTRRATGGDDVRTVADTELEVQTQRLEKLEPISETEVAGHMGYQFIVESGLGTPTSYYVWEMDGAIIVTSQTIMDPNDEGYQDDVRAIKHSIVVSRD